MPKTIQELVNTLTDHKEIKTASETKPETIPTRADVANARNVATALEKVASMATAKKALPWVLGATAGLGVGATGATMLQKKKDRQAIGQVLQGEKGARQNLVSRALQAGYTRGFQDGSKGK